MARRSDRSSRRAPRPRARRLFRRALLVLFVLLVLLPLSLTLLFRAVPPPATPLMLLRLADGHGIDRSWQAFEAISPHLGRAVIAAEDNRFCSHWGFDVQAIRQALEEAQEGGRLRGASTISMQTAKNLFLWPSRSWLRKGLEAYLTPYLELLWPKRRILEVYLNIAEWGPGVYGAQAAARHHFGKPAKDLSRREAALLASVLPNPLALSAGAPSAHVRKRATVIERRVGQLGPLLDCAG